VSRRNEVSDCSVLVHLSMQVLVADINIGYEDIVNTQVNKT
jgi:hypothetical protein